MRNIKQHEYVMKIFLQQLNDRTDKYVLKGGTALAQCYGLDRLSEDIDLDSTQKIIEPIITQFCADNHYTYRTKKDTETVQRYMVDYDHELDSSLKIEASYRKKEIPADDVTNINGITVYKINPLCVQKCAAYAGRDKIRDLYDLAFIVNTFYGQLETNTRSMVQTTLEHKGFEQFDYIMQTQSDPLINNDKLETEFLTMWDKMGLLTPKTLQ